MTDKPKLYWISGSTPSWRVMLGLTLKGIPFDSCLLDYNNRENREDWYLALNPKGQVPTLKHGDVVIRESIAILAYLDRAWPERPIFGSTPTQSAEVWQSLILFENDFRPAIMTIAQTLLRNKSAERQSELSSALTTLNQQLDSLNETLTQTPYINGEQPMATDAWLVPALGWINRAAEKTDDPVPDDIKNTMLNRTSLENWIQRFEAVPGVSDAYPPHWRNS